MANITGTPGNETIPGTDQDDTIDGGAGDDRLFGFEGRDSLIGGEGNDTVEGFEGNDTLLGDAGNDTLVGGEGADLVSAGAGDDVIEGGLGADTVTYAEASNGVTVDLDAGTAFGEGNDTIILVRNATGSAFDDVISGDSVANALVGGDGDDTILGLGGNDRIDGGAGVNFVDGGAGDDRITDSSGGDVVVGGLGNDTLRILDGDANVRVDLSAGVTELNGLIGSVAEVEVVTTGNGDDLLAGDAGNNFLNAFGGENTVISGDGNDTLVGGLANDLFQVTGSGDNIVSGGGAGSDQDTLDYSLIDGPVTVSMTSSGRGTATRNGGETDTFFEVETFSLTGMNDLFAGSTGDDSVAGEGGDDVLLGEAGEDTLDGGAGDDNLSGGAGNDVLTGGAGNDLFVFSEGNGSNQITDFTLGEDLFDVSDLVSRLPEFSGQTVRPSEVTVTNNAPLPGSPFFPLGSQTLTFPDGTEVTVPENTIRTSDLDDQLDDLAEAGIVCFVRGTQIQTEHGERSVESLKVGDRVRTVDNGLMPIQWIGSRRTLARGRQAPVRLSAGSVGNHSDLWVSQQHRILVEGWKPELYFGEPEVLVPAAGLLSDAAILVDTPQEVEFWHIMLETHELVRANGAAVETLLPGREALNTLDLASVQQVLACIKSNDGFVSKSDFFTPARPILKVNEARVVLRTETGIPERQQATRWAA